MRRQGCNFDGSTKAGQKKDNLSKNKEAKINQVVSSLFYTHTLKAFK